MVDRIDTIGLVSAFNALKRRYDSGIKSIEQMAEHIQTLQGIITKQELQLKSLIKSNQTKQKIMKSSVDIANETNNKYLEEISELRIKLKGKV
jgi:hypothetical protein